jgi:selenocysteine lyase/cysteine desulfurase
MRKYFPALLKYRNCIFCDNAGGSQVPKQVYNAFTEFLTNNYVQPYGNNILSQKITKSLEEIHYITNTILNNQKGQIAYGSSCSQLVYNLAHAMENELILEKNNEIILTDFSHEACVSPFERLAIKNDLKLHWWSLKNSKSNKYEINSTDLLSKVNENTKLVVIPHVSNILGNVIDVKELTKSIKEINNDTKVLVDGVAYLPHGIVDVDDYDVDYYVVSFYKFCALRVSALYVKDSLSIKNQYHYFFDNEESIKKIEIGGANYESASSILGLRDYFMDLAKNYKYHYKIFNRELVEFVMTKINNYEASLTDLFKICTEDNYEIEIIECKESIKLPIFALRFKNYNENNVNLILNELGIICKNGTFYCNRLFDNLNICKQRGVLRISFMHYNTLDECKTIVSALNLFKKIESSFRFKLDYKYKNQVSHILSKSFDNLSINKYYNIKKGRGFSLLKVDNLDKLEIIGDLNFYQNESYNNYNGNVLRKYSNLSEDILDDELFKYLVQTFKEQVDKVSPVVTKYIQVHQTRVYANSSSTNLVPKGIHQDGYNFIAISCINRKNIRRKLNNVYISDKTIKFYSTTLNAGEILILNDRKMFHDVTNIELNNLNEVGYTDIFVFTTIS